MTTTARPARDLAAERLQLDDAVLGLTLGHVLKRNADHWADRPAVSWQEGSSWKGLTWAEYRERAGALQRAVPGLTLSSDIIVGFPGETREDFALTLELVREIGFVSVFGFKYSPRPGTPAARMPSISAPASSGPDSRPSRPTAMALSPASRARVPSPWPTARQTAGVSVLPTMPRMS